MNFAPRVSAHTVPTIAAFLRAHVEQAGAHGVVVGLSGGIDSALVARLARDALGAERVVGVLSPDGGYPAALGTETAAYAASLGVATESVQVEPIVESFLRALPGPVDRVARGNILARVRMTVVYQVARARAMLVAGTGNKSELLMGYFTKYGDGGVDLLPIGDLYKTDVRALADELGLPEAIRARVPTAGLWEGQTDAAEMGIDYPELDRVLLGLEELRSLEEVAGASGVVLAEVRRVAERVRQGRHKRRLPPIPKLRLRTVGVDWRD